MNAHYVYKITNINPVDSRKYYIGVHTCENIKPEEDVSYMGSSKYLNEAIQQQGKENFIKEILSTWETRELANAEEARLHVEINVAANPEYYNRANATGNGFCRFNTVPVIDTRDGKTKDVSKEDFYKFDYYVHVTKGNIIVRDERDGLIKTVSTDDFNNSDYYVGLNKGMVTVIDVRDGTTKNVSKEDFDKFDYYVSKTKGTIKVIDKRDGLIKTVSNEEYKKNDFFEFIQKGKLPVIDTRDGTTKHITKKDYEKYDYFVNPRSKRIDIFDNNDNLVVSCFGNFKKICKENGFPAAPLAKSYRENIKVFENLPPNHLSRIKKRKEFKFIGWYARLCD